MTTIDTVTRELAAAMRAWAPHAEVPAHDRIRRARARELGEHASIALASSPPDTETALAVLEEAAVIEGGFGSRPSYDAAYGALRAHLGLPAAWQDED